MIAWRVQLPSGTMLVERSDDGGTVYAPVALIADPGLGELTDHDVPDRAYGPQPRYLCWRHVRANGEDRLVPLVVLARPIQVLGRT